MTQNVPSVSRVCTARHYAVGIHYAWEAAAHVAAKEFFLKNSYPWDAGARGEFIDHYLREKPYALAHALVQCPVCTPAIADGILSGTEKPLIDPVTGQRLTLVNLGNKRFDIRNGLIDIDP